MPVPPSLAIRCDGGRIPEIGTGHIVRMLDLAGALVDSRAFARPAVRFVSLEGEPAEPGRRMVERAGFAVTTLGGGGQSGRDATCAERDALLRCGAETILIDRLNTTLELIDALRSAGRRVVSFDDRGDGAVRTHATINGIVETRVAMPHILDGLSYLMLPNARRVSTAAGAAQPTEPIRMAATFGGYDHRNLAGLLLEALATVDPQSVDITLATGLCDPVRRESLEAEVRRLRVRGGATVRLVTRFDDFVRVLETTDLAVSAGGLTMFEFAACGIPCVALPQYPHQTANIARMARLGAVAAVDSGGSRAKDRARLAETLAALLMNVDRRAAMSRAAAAAVDRHGVDRVVEQVVAVRDRGAPIFHPTA